MDYYFVMIKLSLGIESWCHNQGITFTTKRERVERRLREGRVGNTLREISAPATLASQGSGTYRALREGSIPFLWKLRTHTDKGPPWGQCIISSNVNDSSWVQRTAGQRESTERRRGEGRGKGREGKATEGGEKVRVKGDTVLVLHPDLGNQVPQNPSFKGAKRG